MEFYDCYALDYRQARENFLHAAQAVGAALHCYTHPTALGPDGGALHTDVAVVGPADAARRLLVISATHGLEGACGSACQVRWLRDAVARNLPSDTAVVLVHAINPWGFAHQSRTTENNVDLNRNFIDHAQGHPDNEVYAQVHPALCHAAWTQDALAQAQAALDALTQRLGQDQVFDALARGQYSHPSGLNYGGQQREWSNRLLETIVQAHVQGAQKVAVIDWHTGLGEYGSPFFLCFDPLESQAYRAAQQWWGEQALANARPHGRARPDYQGLLIKGVQRFLGATPVAGAVIEFGTRGWHMRRLLRLDLWLKTATDLRPDARAQLQADLRDGFCPVDQIWRDSTLLHGLRITEQAVQGVAQW